MLVLPSLAVTFVKGDAGMAVYLALGEATMLISMFIKKSVR